MVRSYNVSLLEVEVLEREVDLYDSGGLDSGPQDVLLRRLVVLGSQPLQVIKEAARMKKKLDTVYL